MSCLVQVFPFSISTFTISSIRLAEKRDIPQIINMINTIGFKLTGQESVLHIQIFSYLSEVCIRRFSFDQISNINFELYQDHVIRMSCPY